MKAEPHNIEAEQGLLGALLLNNSVLDRIELTEADFYDPIHAKIFKYAAAMIGKGMPCSAVTLKPYFKDDEGLGEIGGTEYLGRMAGAAISITVAPDYARMIREMAKRRLLIALGEEIEGAAADFTVERDVDDIIADVEKGLLALNEQVTETTNMSFAKVAAVAVDRMNDAFHGKEIQGVDLGIPELTMMTGRARPGELILLAGRPSMGKSAVAAEMALRAAKNGWGVVYWCGEMQGTENAERMLSSEAARRGTRIPYRDAVAGRMTEEQFKALLEVGRDLEKLPLVFVDSKRKQMDRLFHEIRKETRRLQDRIQNHVLVVVDYLQMIEGKGLKRYEDVTAISQGLKGLAIDLETPVLSLAQLSRRVEDRDNKRPRLSDLRESGQIEQDAQTVIFAYRDEYYIERQMPPDDDEKYPASLAALEQARGKMELIIAKQRSGPLGTAHVDADLAVNRVMSRARQGGYADENQQEFSV